MEKLWLAVFIGIMVYRALNKLKGGSGTSYKGTASTSSQKPRKRQAASAKSHTVTITNLQFYRTRSSITRLIQNYSGWTFQQAKEFLQNNTVLNLHNQKSTESMRVMEFLKSQSIPVASFKNLPNQDVIVLSATPEIVSPPPAKPASSRTQRSPEQVNEIKFEDLVKDASRLLRTHVETQTISRPYKKPRPVPIETYRQKPAPKPMPAPKQKVETKPIPEDKPRPVVLDEEDPFGIQQDQGSTLLKDGIGVENPQSLIEAIIMKEILDRPVSERDQQF